MNSKFMSIAEVESRPVDRFQTGMGSFDWLYGYTATNGMATAKWGFPAHRISLLSGESGTGKSRLAIRIAKECSPVVKVLYIQTEAPLEDFAGWAGDVSHPANLIVSNASTLCEIERTIYTVNPGIVFIDSVNEIREFVNGNKQETELMMHGGEGPNGTVLGLRTVANELTTHIFLLNQLNQDGTIKGGTSLVHLCDMHLELLPVDRRDKTTFILRTGIKIRGGRCGKATTWRHTNQGVEAIQDGTSYDREWCESHGQVVAPDPSIPSIPVVPQQRIIMVTKRDGTVVAKTPGQLTFQEALDADEIPDHLLPDKYKKANRNRKPGLKDYWDVLIGKK